MAFGERNLTAGRRRHDSPISHAGGLARDHWLLSVILLIGAAVRVLVMIAYPPALFFPDSWGYLSSAFSNGSLVGLPGLRPVGYSALIRILTIPDRGLTQLVAIQHLCGLAIGLTIYAVLIRLRLPRWAAAGAAALVLLDGYAITLEQYVMSDTFFSATLLATILLLSWPRLMPGGRSGIRFDAATYAVPATRPGSRRAREYTPISTRRAGAAGLTLAVCALEREVATVLIPVLVVYLVWARVGWRPLVTFLVAAVIPLGAYASLVDHKYHVFGLTATSGWTLYGRVAGFADCTGVSLPANARPLCERTARRDSHPRDPTWYIWGPSPAQHLFDPETASITQSAHANSILRTFSERIALHQPLSFASATLGDFSRYFTPGATPFENGISATSLPAAADGEASDPAVRRRYLPGLQPSVQSPAGLVRGYRSVFHLPRPVLAVLALAALLALLARIPARREVFAFAGSGLVLLLGTAATGGLGLRYLVPAVPLLAIGGCLALAQLFDAR